MNMIDEAIKKLSAGEIVALPTETVYGLAVDARNINAINKLYALKKRDTNKPLAVAIARPNDATQWAATVDINAQQLIKAFWPGPLTLVLPAEKSVSPLITAGRNSIGLRCSSCQLITAIIDKLGGALCLTSANMSGEKEATTAQEVRTNLQSAIFILESDDIVTGIPSTIIDLTNDPYKVLRQGAISAENIQTIVSQRLI